MLAMLLLHWSLRNCATRWLKGSCLLWICNWPCRIPHYYCTQITEQQHWGVTSRWTDTRQSSSFFTGSDFYTLKEDRLPFFVCFSSLHSLTGPWHHLVSVLLLTWTDLLNVGRLLLLLSLQSACRVLWSSIRDSRVAALFYRVLDDSMKHFLKSALYK